MENADPACCNEDEVSVYVDQLKAFSSQYGSENSSSYVIGNILGAPRRYPQYGDFTETAVFRTYGPWWKTAPETPKPLFADHDVLLPDDFVIVGWSTPLYLRSIDIYETYNPGSIIRILGKDVDKDGDGLQQWYTLWQAPHNRARLMPALSTIFTPKIRKPKFRCNTISLEFRHDISSYYTEIDAVKVTGCSSYDVDSVLEDNVKKEGSDALDATISSTFEVLSLEASGTSESIPQKVFEDDNGWFGKLPPEVILHILGFLTLADLRRTVTVSLLFKSMCSSPRLPQYIYLNLKPYWHRVTSAALHSLSTLCVHGKTLNISWLSKAPPPEIVGPHLLRLDMDACQFDDIECDQLLKACGKYGTLTHLSLASSLNFSPKYFRLASLTQLKWLNLSRSTMDLSNLKIIITNCKKLEYINIGACVALHNVASEVLECLGDSCPHLKGLDFWRIGRHQRLALTSIEAFCNGCSLLESLDFGWNRLPAGCVHLIARKAPNMRKLFLTATRGTQNSDLLMLAKYCPKLEMFDVLGNSDLSLVGVEAILESCPRMRFLDISFCNKIKTEEKRKLRDTYPHCNIKDSFCYSTHV